jgi:hypothetical protein
VQASHLHAELRARGLDLGVNQFRANPEVLAVNLFSPDDQPRNARARQLIAGVPGVLAVAESLTSPAVVLVRVSP